MVTLSISLFCLTLALIQVNDADKGWTSSYILTLFGIAVVFLIAFIIGELRQPFPMVDLHLFATPRFTGAALVAFGLGVGLLSLLFFLTLYLQNYLGFTPAQSWSANITNERPHFARGAIGRRGTGEDWLATYHGGRDVRAYGSKIMLSLLLTTSQQQTTWLILLPTMILEASAAGW